VNRDLPSIAGAIQSVIWDHSQWPWPLHVVTRSGLEVEFYTYRADVGRWAKPVARILKQAPDFFRPAMAAADEDPGVRPGNAQHAVRAAETFWREVPDVLRALRHDELPFAYSATLRLLLKLLAVLSERAPRPMRNRVASNYRLDPADAAAVVAAMRLGPLTRGRVIRRLHALTALMSDRGRTVCESLGAPYPSALDAAMTARMYRDIAQVEAHWT
jgi:hypothetical protein